MIRVIWEHAAALVLLASMATWLMGLLRVARSPKGMAVTAITTLLIGLIPFGGVSAAGMVLSLSPSLSVAGTALWGGLLLARLRPGAADMQRSTQGLAILVTAVSLPVLVSFIGGIGPDIYGSGYGFSLWDVVMAGSAVMLFIRGSRVSLVLMACLLAHAGMIMSSSNIFDTLLDGPAFLLSVPITLKYCFIYRGPLPKTEGL